MALQHIVSGALLMTAGGALSDACCCDPTPPGDCSWYLSPSGLVFDCNVQSGAFNVNVPTGSNCGWEATVTSGSGYVTITAGSSGNTDGAIDFDLDANSDPDRTAQITVVTTVASNLGPIGTVIGVFTVTQEECTSGPGGTPPGSGGGSPPPPGGTCTWSISPNLGELNCFAQSTFFNVNTQLGCGWSASVTFGGAYITITSGSSGNDAGQVHYSILGNAGASRGGQIRVVTTVVSALGPIGSVIGIYNITQDTCPGGGGGAPCAWNAGGTWYVGDPCNVETGTSEVKTYAGCGWTATVTIGGAFVTITGGSTGLSSGTITFDIQPNTTCISRTATIEVTTGSASVFGPVGTVIGYVNIWQVSCIAAACPGGLTGPYAIDGYVDGLIPASGCGLCIAGVGDPVWDGSFVQSGPPCNFLSATDVTIDNRSFLSPGVSMYLVPGMYWEIFIGCEGGGTWIWRKFIGCTPEGVYTSNTTCGSGPATLTII